ncbi:MAG: VCBS repeat-containing protein [Proteobacteria bacterium]|nr:VCBS repeat-containing protein [Pseudomonadota bacterium]
MIRFPALVLFLTLPLVAAVPAIAADDEPFEILSIPGDGRTVAAELADLNGDGRTDLLQIAIIGIPPAERRLIRVRYQTAEGTLPELPDLEVEVPANSAVYDMADLRDTPGDEIVFLRPDRLTIVSLASPPGQRWDLPVPGANTVGAAQDERGLDPFRLVWNDFGPEPWLLVPQLGRMTALSPRGEVLATFAVGARANYFVPSKPSLYFMESDIQLFLDFPAISVADADGDGRADVMASTRHDLRVYRQRDDGSFPVEPDQLYELGLVTESDHIRGSGGVATQARDFDGDGRADLLITHVSGSFADARTQTMAYLNRGDHWDLAHPDQTYTSESTLGSATLIDLDGDGVLELVRAGIPFSVLEFIEVIVTRAIDVRVAIYKIDGEGGFAKKPWRRMKLDLSLSFDTFRTSGFLPTMHGDLNADGHRDLLLSGDGDQVEVFLGGPKQRFSEPDAIQKLDTQGVLHLGDWDGDGLTDLLIFNPHEPGSPTRIARNRGRL